jgi:hypothetical protein
MWSTSSGNVRDILRRDPGLRALGLGALSEDIVVYKGKRCGDKIHTYFDFYRVRTAGSQ